MTKEQNMLYEIPVFLCEKTLESISYNKNTSSYNARFLISAFLRKHCNFALSNQKSKIIMKKRSILFLTVLAVILVEGVFAIHWAWKYYQLPLFSDSSRYANMTERAEQAQNIARGMGLNEKYCIFVDYSLPSGTPRMFVWSFDEGRVIASTYVMHGSGMGSTDEKPVFSNTPGSNCSSLGRFAITHEHGNRNKSGYFVRGLDFSNQSARGRALMVHRAKWVDINCWRQYIPVNSKCCQGCFTVSSRGMDYIGQLVEHEPKQILLWSYCSENNM